METLTARREAILAIVVREHIDTAMPVSSRTLADQYDLGISSATIRNEMALLEEEGYLTHPYTSAGRIPTDKGYRYFVHRLMEEVELPLAEQRTIRHQFHQARMGPQQWAKLAAAVLAHTARSAALVMAARTSRCRFKHLELISINDTLIFLILVLRNGMVQQRMITSGQPLAQEDLSRMANRLNSLLAGLTVDGIQATSARPSLFEERVLECVIEVMDQVDRHSSEIYRDGLIHILRQPEFAVVEKAEQLVQLLEQGYIWESILSEAMARNGVQVIVGGEGRWSEIDECSIVLSRYGIADEAMGALGVLGPMRMAYGRAVSAVRYVADLMNDLVRQLYGNSRN